MMERIKEPKDDPAQALRNITALDGPSFLPNVMTLQRASTPWQYNTPCRFLEARRMSLVKMLTLIS